MLKDKILEIRNKVVAEIEKAKESGVLFEVEKKYLGRKSEFTSILKGLKDLSVEEKKQIGELANQTKNEILEIITRKKESLNGAGFDAKEEKIDVTIPGKKNASGHFHPLTLVRQRIEDIFSQMGYEIADGPEVETEKYNFDALNIPSDHPARDMQDTFYVKSDSREKLSMRCQTSAVQARYMEKHQPPFRIIVPGKCFRREATDTTHEHTFYQFEGLVVGDNINVRHLKFTAQEFFSQFFETEVKVRLRPSYFPFTEPSFEFDISCLVCGGKARLHRYAKHCGQGCRACKGGGWLELGGAGMVNQNVFVSAGYPRGKYTGFAWGFGLERLAMMKYKIDEVRLFHSGDLRFIKQF